MGENSSYHNGNYRWPFVLCEFCVLKVNGLSTVCISSSDNTLIDVEYLDFQGRRSTYQSLVIHFWPLSFFFPKNNIKRQLIYSLPRFATHRYFYEGKLNIKRKKPERIKDGLQVPA